MFAFGGRHALTLPHRRPPTKCASTPPKSGSLSSFTLHAWRSTATSSAKSLCVRCCACVGVRRIPLGRSNNCRCRCCRSMSTSRGAAGGFGAGVSSGTCRSCMPERFGVGPHLVRRIRTDNALQYLNESTGCFFTLRLPLQGRVAHHKSNLVAQRRAGNDHRLFFPATAALQQHESDRRYA